MPRIDRKRPPARLAPALLLATLLIAGCLDQTHDSLLADAKSSLAKGDTSSAEIQIKGALQQQSQSFEARLLMGQLLLDRGDSRAAELELRKAAELKTSPHRVLPQLAQAMLANREYRKLVSELNGQRFPQQPEADADLNASLAVAHEALGNRAASDLALQAALKAKPGHGRTQIFQARTKARGGDRAGALRLLEQLLTREPTLGEAWRLKGDLILTTGGDAESAIAAYRQALKLRPKDLAAHQGLLEYWIEHDKLDAAIEQLQALKRAQPGHAQTVYYEAMLLHKTKQNQAARELLVQLLSTAPDNAKGLQLAGAVELELQSYNQAEEWLGKALSLAPELTDARRLLVQTYLATNRGDKAVATLQPLLQTGGGDVQVLGLAGEAYLMAGDKRRADAYFAQVLKLNPDDWRSRTLLAKDGLNTARHQQALAELREIAKSDPGVAADVAQMRAHLQRREFDQALAVIDRLEQKQPQQPLAHNLRGMVRLARNDVPRARQSFEQALKLDPRYFPAVALLSSLDIAEKYEGAARARFEGLLKLEPGHAQALLALAELTERAGDGKAAQALLAKAVQLNPNSAAARVELVEHYIKNQDLKAAALAAQQGMTALPDRPELLEIQGRVQTLNGEYNQAMDSFRSLARALPRSPQPALRIAELHIARKELDRAIASLQKALELAPDYRAARQRLSEVQLATGDGKSALETARRIQRQRPDLPAGFTLEGDVHAAAKSWGLAATGYRRSLVQAPNSQVAAKLHHVLLQGGAGAEAQTMAQGWLNKYPNDADFPFYLGSAATLAGRLGEGQANFLTVVKLQPNNAPALNNLAWIALVLNQAGAMAYAERANQLVPKHPAFMDTLSMALEAENRLPEALSVQREALALQPLNHPLRLRLAKLQIKAGEKTDARGELEYLLKLGRQYPAQGEVRQLMSSL